MTGLRNMVNKNSGSLQINQKKDWGRVVSLIFVIPLFYLFLPNFLVGHIGVEFKAYLVALFFSLSVSLVIYRSLNKWDSQIGLVNEKVSDAQKFWSFWGIALSVGSLLLASLIAINSIDAADATNEGSLPPPFKDTRTQEFCPLGMWGKANPESDIPILCVLVLHVPNLSVFVAGDEVAKGESCLYYGIQSGRLGMKFLAPSLTCMEQRAIEISEKLRISDEDYYPDE